MNRKNILPTLYILLIFCLFGCMHKQIPKKYKGGNQHAVYESPKKDYTIVLYRIPMKFSMPGGASDAPGIVCLYNEQGEILKEKKIDMIQNMVKPEWGDKMVSINSFVDWELKE
jgi:hypothetical protein